VTRPRALLLLAVFASAGVWAFTVGTVVPALPAGPLEVAGGAQAAPLILTTPGRPVAVWADERDRIFRVYASRFHQDTLDPLDGPGGLYVGTSSGDGYGFTAAWGGSSFLPGGHVLVVWPVGGLQGRRLDLDGGRSAPIIIGTPGIADLPSLASNGDDFLLAFEDESVAPPRVVAMPLLPSGVSPGGMNVTLSNAGVRATHPRAVWAGGRWVVTWMEGNAGATEVVARVAGPGAPGPIRTLSAAAGAEYPEIIALPDGGAFVAFFEGGGGALTGVSFESMGPPATLVADAGWRSWYGFTEQRPSMATLNGEVWVAWSRTDPGLFDDRLRLARVPAPFTAVATSRVRTSAPGIVSEPSLATFQGRMFLAYADRDNMHWDWDTAASDVAVEELGLNLAPVSARGYLARAPAEQLEPVLASDGTNLFAAWTEYRRDAGYDVFAARVLDRSLGAPRLVATGASGQVEPAIGAWESGVAIAWTELAAREVRVAFFDSGLVPRTATQTVAAGSMVIPDFPCIAVGGPTVFVAFTDGADVRTRRYSLDGVPLESAQVLCPGCVGNGRPFYERTACAFGGGEFLVAWVDDRVAERAMVAARVLLDGGRPDPGGKVISLLSRYPAEPTIAWDGRQFLVAWHDHRNSTAFGEMWGSRFRDGTVVDVEGRRLVSASGAEQEFPHLTPVPGGALLLTWYDEGFQEVRSQHLIDGVATDFPGEPFDGQGNRGIASASVAGRTVLLVSQGYESQTPSGAVRLYLNTIERAGGGAACSFAFDCASGSCDGGACAPVEGGAGGGSAGGATAGGSAAGGGGTAGGDSTAGGGGDVAPPSERRLGVGCGCDSTGDTALLLLTLVFTGHSRRRRTSSRVRYIVPA